MHMENDENFDLDKLEAQLINNDDTFSETTSSYNGDSFSKADKKLILLIDKFDIMLVVCLALWCYACGCFTWSDIGMLV